MLRKYGRTITSYDVGYNIMHVVVMELKGAGPCDRGGGVLHLG